MFLRSIIKNTQSTAFIFFISCFFSLSVASAETERKILLLPEPEGPVVLEVNGNINKPTSGKSALFDMDMLRALPVHTLKTTTLVTDGVHTFTGFLVRDFLEYIQSYGKTITTYALNDYVVKIDVDDFYDYDVIVAYEMDGKQLQASDKGPLWIVYPRDDHKKLQDIRYDYKWVWQLFKIDIH